MKVIPAIDLWDGKVVRLLKGNPDLSTIYSDDPIEVANKWKDQGADLLHLVDLSAALGQKDNVGVIEKILKEVDIKVEIGGGIRDIEKAEKLISLGAERVIIGTKGMDENFLKKVIKSVSSSKLAVSVDVVDSYLAVKGWKEKTTFKTFDFIEFLRNNGVKWIIYTDISRDGTLDGIDFTKINELSVYNDLNIIVSGGVSSIDDIKEIKEKTPFVWGVITGKAIYEDKLSLLEAFKI